VKLEGCQIGEVLILMNLFRDIMLEGGNAVDAMIGWRGENPKYFILKSFSKFSLHWRSKSTIIWHWRRIFDDNLQYKHPSKIIKNNFNC